MDKIFTLNDESCNKLHFFTNYLFTSLSTDGLTMEPL